MPFYFTKIADGGTSNPIIARLTVGLPEIIHIIQMSKDDKQKIIDSLFDISEALIEAEKSALQVIEEINRIESKLAEKTKMNAFPDHPKVIDSVLSLNRARDFLKYSKAAFRKLGKIISISFKIENHEHKFGHAVEALKKNIASDSNIFEIFSHYKPLYKKIMDLRNDDEHDKDIESFLLNYEIKQGDGFYYLDRPRFYDDTKVYELLVNSLSLILPFCEDLVLACLIDYLPEMIEVVEIPQEKRNLQCPKRFCLTLSGHVNSIGHG